MRNSRAGFTLAELIVALGIMLVMAAFTLGINVRGYSRSTLQSEKDTLVSVLSNARSASLENLNQSAHGVYLASSTSYILFEGASYAARDASKDIAFPKSSGVIVGGTPEVIFAPLSATSTTAVITLTNDAQSQSITVNSEGGIEW